jgi:hypothetical protein
VVTGSKSTDPHTEEHTMHVTVANPDAPFDSPAYDGPADQAHRFLIAGNYPCSFEATDGDFTGTLVVTVDGSHVIPTHTDTWTDAYGNGYVAITAATGVKVGTDVMLIPGTSYRYEDVSNYDDGEMSKAGTVEDATDVDGDLPVCGTVEAVKLVGDRAHLTIVDDPCPAWTYSVPAAMPVYVYGA